MLLSDDLLDECRRRCEPTFNVNPSFVYDAFIDDAGRLSMNVSAGDRNKFSMVGQKTDISTHLDPIIFDKMWADMASAVSADVRGIARPEITYEFSSVSKGCRPILHEIV